MRDRDEIETFHLEDIRRRCRFRPVGNGDPAVRPVGNAYRHFAFGAFIRRDPQRVARANDECARRVVLGEDVERLPRDIERLR